MIEPHDAEVEKQLEDEAKARHARMPQSRDSLMAEFGNAKPVHEMRKPVHEMRDAAPYAYGGGMRRVTWESIADYD